MVFDLRNLSVGYALRRGLGLIVSAFRVLCYKLIYGPSALRGPTFCFGAGLNVNIRNGGVFEYGTINVRRNLSIFCDGGRVRIGGGAFFNAGCSLNAMEEISIGENTLFGEGVKVYDHNHCVQSNGEVSHNEFATAPISIGRNCWIGSNVVILKGVNICDGVTVGAGAVISRSIPEPGVYVCRSLSALTHIR